MAGAGVAAVPAKVERPSETAPERARGVAGLSREGHAIVDSTAIADQDLLRSPVLPRATAPSTGRLRVADLFSGCGIMSLGVALACRDLGLQFVPKLAVDLNEPALDTYFRNFEPRFALRSDIRAELNGEFGTRPTASEKRLRQKVGAVDVLIGGPPCQGHSDLNNRTRRHDPKNSLYERMARFAEIFEPKHVLVENVPAVRHDRGRVVERTRAALESLGYRVSEHVLDPSELGVAQRRRRHFLVATRRQDVELADRLERHRRPVRTLRWAIGDLEWPPTDRLFDKPSTPTRTAKRRIEFLFRKDLFDLPNAQRPACHRDKQHSYVSVYGRLHWDRPAQTITTGFNCMGQGRYVHPSQPRTITPHEAARIQFIPDFFQFDDAVGRTALAEMIGNAVPAQLSRILALELLR